MGLNYVEILARIRLNLANVDQFLAIACGLADDNPSLGRPVHEAASEIRSSALLIDHLRSLFCHQQSIERQQFEPLAARRDLSTSGGGGAHTDNLSYFSYSNKQTLIRAAKSLVANVAKILYLTDEIILKSSCAAATATPPQFYQQPNWRRELSPNGNSRYRGPQSRADTELEIEHKEGHLSAAGRPLTTGRRRHPSGAEAAHQQPAPSLAFSVHEQQQQQSRASDIIKLNQEAGVGYHQQDTSASANLDTGDVDDETSGGGQLGDRLDNVANYSQLLRSFGEFSVDLIDLGNCIMLARHSNQANRACCCCCSCCPSTRKTQATAELYSEDLPLRDYHSRRLDSTSASHGPGPEYARGACPSGPAEENSNLRPSSSSYSMAHLHHNNQTISPYDDHHQELRRDSLRSVGPDYYQQQQRRLENDWRHRQHLPTPPTLNNNHQQPPTPPTLERTSSSCCHLKALNPENCHLRAQLQDMLALFQVNRLVIDRSILLLLSASKCCLRQGRERASGLEARKSIAVQIRVSISIIMALAKCSVFGLVGGSGQQAASQWRPSLASHEGLGPVTANEGHAHSSSSSPFKPTAGDHHYARRTSQQHTNNEKNCLAPTGLHYLGYAAASSSSSPPPPPLPMLADHDHLQQMSYDFEQHQGPGAVHRHQLTQPPPPPGAAHSTTINGGQHLPARALSGTPTLVREHGRSPLGPLLDNDNNNNNYTGRQVVGSMGASAASGRPMMDIMNHFLLTCNGTRSAHDAIRGFQILVEPFVRVQCQDGLARELNRAFANLGAGHHHVRHAPASFTGSPAGQTGGGCIEEEDDDDEEREKAAAWDKENAEQPVETINKTQRDGDTGSRWLPVVLMNKRQLVRALNVTFLGELKHSLVERVHEFTDCAYTKHERRERIVSLLAGIKFLLNKFVKLIYRLRRRVASPSEPLQLGQLRQFATRLVDFCAELDHELQSVVIEHGDELDRLSGELNLLKQMKHHCLVGDTTRARQALDEFLEQSEQLIEVCQQLNQIAPTNKLKITSKSLAIWFRMNLGQLVQVAGCLSENSHSRMLKDCSWTYMQVWSSFYDDFCQLARQVSYLAHANYDPARSSRVTHHWQQIDDARANRIDPLAHDSEHQREQQREVSGTGPHELLLIDRHHSWAAPGDSTSGLPRPLGSVQSLSNITFGRRAQVSPAGTLAGECGPYDRATGQPAVGPQYQPHNDSPRSLDHYHGFGPNYRRHHDAQFVDYHHNQQQQQQVGPVGSGYTSSRDSSLMASPSLSQFAVADADHWRQREYHEHEHHHRQQQQVFGAQDEFRASANTSTPPPNSVWQSTPSTSVANRQESYFVPTPMGGFVSPPAPTSISVDPTAPPIEPPSVPARRSAPLSEGQSGQSMAGSSDAPVGSEEVLSSRRHRRANCAAASSRRSQQRRPLATEPMTEPAEALAEVVAEADQEVGKGAVVAPSAPAPAAPASTDQQSVASSSNLDKWSDSEADAIVRGARETAQMALSMYQFTRGEGDLNTTQDLFTQAELFAEEANELYKEVRCFSYKVPAGDLKKELLYQLSHIPALVQQLQFTVKNPTVGKAATFAKVDSVIRETKCLMEAVNRVVEATLSCRQHYNMASSSLRKRTRTLSPSYRGDKGGFDFESFDMPGGGGSGGGGRPGGAFGGPGGTGRHGASGASGGMGSEPDI